jgi:hypothetical protein
MLPEPVNSDAADFCPTPLRGKDLLFVSTRGGTDAYGTTACGGGDIYLTRRSPATGAWDPPMNLGCTPNGPNGAGTEYGPSLVETDAGPVLFFSSGGILGSNTQDIYMSSRQADGSFDPPQPVTELNTAYDDVRHALARAAERLLLTVADRGQRPQRAILHAPHSPTAPNCAETPVTWTLRRRVRNPPEAWMGATRRPMTQLRTRTAHRAR